MMQVNNATQWWPPNDKEDGKARKGSPVAGVVYIPAKRVTDAARRIAYDAPGGWFAQTITGNVQLSPGDWVVRCGSGHVYAIKQVDWWPGLGVRVSRFKYPNIVFWAILAAICTSAWVFVQLTNRFYE